MTIAAYCCLYTLYTQYMEKAELNSKQETDNRVYYSHYAGDERQYDASM